ncbi:MAG TPA: efflux RND transporter periplasmic adaptor subunit [Gemmatimonadales bacterium]|nr:efflux RND transporter periplasmic adaptor subunit [Gemmatimonadales bacterium]
MNQVTTKRRARLPLAALTLVSLAPLGCKKSPPPAFPPTEVSVVTVVPRTIDLVYDFAGEVQAAHRVEVRSNVTGVIVSRPYTEGSEVRAGDLLFKIDPTIYDAAWRSAKARLAQAEARLNNAQRNSDRLRPLLADSAVARQEVDNAENELAQAKAGVEDATAEVDRTRKDLNDTDVRAQISGRAGQAYLLVGARVTGTGDLLTTVDALDPVYVNFQPSSQQLLSWRRDARTSRQILPGGSARIQAILPDGTPLARLGRINYVDPVVDVETGTQKFRAEFSNGDRLLVPGQFIRVRVQGLSRDSAIVIPQRAVLLAMGRQTVFVVGAGDTVAAREVQASAWTGDQWLIDQGLAAGDRVIVDGVQKVGPGRVVKPVPLTDSTTAAASLSAGTTKGAGKP